MGGTSRTSEFSPLSKFCVEEGRRLGQNKTMIPMCFCFVSESRMPAPSEGKPLRCGFDLTPVPYNREQN